MMRIGLFGGTFDPPHVGHLWLAETAVAQLKLESVLFLPVGMPPHKPKNQFTAVAHRLQMARLSIQDNTRFILNTTDIERPPPHTTATLLPLIQGQYPTAQLWLLLGADSLRDFTSWAMPTKIIQQCRLAVLGRPGVSINWDHLETAVPGVYKAVDFLAGPTVALSSTEIRNWARAGNSLRYLVNTAVAAYINENNVYNQP
jgi:nicotinate-nucleotide adenylyltransferase